MLRVSYLQHQPRQNWVASIKARRDKHSTAGVSLTSELEYVKFDGSHRLFPAGFRTALCPAEAWFTGYSHEILSSVILSDFFFSLMRENWMFWMFAEVDFFFFCSVLVQRMLTRMRMLEWASSARKVQSLLQQNHMISSYKWVLKPQIEFTLVKKVSAQKAHFNFIPVKFNKNVTVSFKRGHRFFEREESEVFHCTGIRKSVIKSFKSEKISLEEFDNGQKGHAWTVFQT